MVKKKLDRRSAIRGSCSILAGCKAIQTSGSVAANEEVINWQFDTGDRIFSSLEIRDNTVYVGSTDGKLYALNKSDGAVQWRSPTDENVEGSIIYPPTVTENNVYVGAGSVYSFNRSDGSKQWRFDSQGIISTSPAVFQDRVYVGESVTDRTYVYCLHDLDGTETWRFETGGTRSSPTVVNSILYIGSDDGTVYALDAMDGTEVWTFETGAVANPNEWVVSSPVVDNGTVYIGSDDNNVYALDAETGDEKWRYETENIVRASPAIGEEMIYIGSWDGYIYALNKSDGSEQWRFDSKGILNYGKPAIGEDTVYVGTDENNLHAIDLNEGTEIGRFEAQDEIRATTVSNNNVYAAGFDTSVYAIDKNKLSSAEPSSTEVDSNGLTTTTIALLSGGGAIAAIGTFYRVITRSKDKATDSATQDTDTTDDLAKQASEELAQSDQQDDSGQSDQRSELNEQIKTLNSEIEHAESLITEGDLEQARERLSNLESDLTEAKDIAAEEELDDLHDEITALKQRQQDRLTTLTEQVEQRKELLEEIDSLRDKLNHVTHPTDNDEFKTARETLIDLESRFDSVETQAEEHDFEELHDEIATLQEQYEAHLEDVTHHLETQPIPDTIPRAPDISVSYDELTDKEPIGGGGNADVFIATHPTSDGRVTLAIKEPRMSGTLHTDQIERMLQEAETWDKLDDHDHIVGVVDYDSSPIPWIAMEYMNGGHLGAYAGEMGIQQALWTAIAVTKGVRHAHRRGVAHLDLKPANILFHTVEDAWDVPKVADWGLSKHLLEHSKSVEGMSVEYAAPEQFDDEYGSTDDITDVYQLGAVFYELFTGRPPFEGQPFKIIDRVKSEHPTPPSELADLPDGLDEILLTALRKEKDERYESVLLLRNDLQELFDSLD